MVKILMLVISGTLVVPSFAYELSRQERSGVTGLSQMARLLAQKACADRPDNQRASCENWQIRSFAETAARLPALLPPHLSAAEFSGMIESYAKGRPLELGALNSGHGYGGNDIDCRINVC